ncbi:hypothetical protein AWW72_16320 [Acinetobacter sp. NRRL B-65365]|uniref:hypothetical protein n=1 Tax=Acinetobacter sp. NRRL B-65365 TaxID=1785092 RepID=UPI0007A07CD9|nr:hypothetical protein [Acinetobacter sp. NRRL B-65365]KYQ82948.1 hypothetical protein AWW72_16320 [Acinetobacter sp. NRRL B-65365]
MFKTSTTKALILGLLLSTQANAFDIYQFMRWSNYTTNDNKHIQTKNEDEFNKFMKNKNIKRIRVATMGMILSKEKPDPKKIKLIAEQSKLDPDMPICFDIETSFQYEPEKNLPVILESLRLYKEFGGVAPVGVYAVLPQLTPNAYLSPEKKAEFRKINDQYAEIANHVDILFPTLYFYKLKDMTIWDSKAEFNMQEAKRFAKERNLKIMPFLSTSNWRFSDNHTVYIKPLNEKDMTHSLNYLKELGADGVVFWEDARAKQDGSENPAIFDVHKDAFKAIVNFSQKQKSK